MEKKNGFTLIELLAVIIILGILMIIAIPSVTSYINDSRKSAYVDTAKEIVSGTRNVVNNGKLDMYDTNTTYYIPVDYIKTENASKSPYGKFTKAYVGVIYNGTGYKYYWISVDDTGQGVKEITFVDYLDVNKIESDITSNEIENKVKTTGIGNRTNIRILNTETGLWEDYNVEENIGEEGKIIVCKKATELHKVICEKTSNGCSTDIGNGNTIVYGTIPSETLQPGNAFDCDVNYDGKYDSKNERFYYITEEDNKITLIYSKSVNGQSSYSYDSSGENWHGPRDAYQYLPSSSEWNSPGLIKPGQRQILSENGENTTTGGTIDFFNYNDRVARLLTIQEVNIACGKTVAYYTKNELNACNWLMESTGSYETSTGSYGIWLENPRYYQNNVVWFIDSGYVGLYNLNPSYNNYLGIRPVITILKSSLE